MTSRSITQTQNIRQMALDALQEAEAQRTAAMEDTRRRLIAKEAQFLKGELAAVGIDADPTGPEITLEGIRFQVIGHGSAFGMRVEASMTCDTKGHGRSTMSVDVDTAADIGRLVRDFQASHYGCEATR